MRTICSSENRAFFIASSCPEKAIIPGIQWSENHLAGEADDGVSISSLQSIPHELLEGAD
jgi:hypothetical protein